MESQKQHSSSIWLGLILIGATVAIITQHLVDIENLIAMAGIYGPIISVLLYVLLSFTPVPSDPITVICGAVYGPQIGLLISTIGNTLAGIAEYFVFFHLGKSAGVNKILAKLPKSFRSKSVHSTSFLLLGRFIPGFGGKLVSISAGVYQVNFFKFLWTTTIASAIGSILFAYGGWGLTRFATH